MIYDNLFLQQLDTYPHKVTHIRLIAIDYWDHPVEAIEGRVTGGNISISGESAIQRTCSLNIIAPEGTQISDVSWAFKNKFTVELGLDNEIDPAKYGDIVWFKQGTFIVKSFSKNIQKDGSVSVSISGMDKMCMLNGILGGTLTSDVNFSDLDTIQDNGDIVTTKVPIYTIIQQAIRQFGNERLENIIINDLPEYGYELWTYRGDEPMYMIKQEGGPVVNMTIDQDASLDNTKLSEVSKYYSTNTLDPNYNKDADTLNVFNIIKIQYGETAGYAPTPLVYAGDLIENAGGTVAGMLDKIAKMLGAYEYFYNVEGQFVFQRKKNYVQEIFSPTDGQIHTPSVLISPYAYQFKDKTLLTSLSYSPAIEKVRNDFAVWGNAKSATGADLPIHARCAIDKKPTRYVSPSWIEKDKDGQEIETNEITYTASPYYDSNPEQTDIKCDWRELIYQMAKDFYNHNSDPDFIIKLINSNPDLIRNGKTGYEQYYVDLQGFWRQLYNPNPSEDKSEEYYPPQPQEKIPETYRCWNKAIHTDPNSLKFWFDFLDPGMGQLAEYAVYNIGDRPKVNNSSTIKSIYYNDTPEVLFLLPAEAENKYDDMTALTRINITPETAELFTISTQGISAIEQINVEINNGACLGEGISFSTLPIYYLLPNTRIKVLDEDYLLTSISFSFGANTVMNLSGSKVIKSII